MFIFRSSTSPKMKIDDGIFLRDHTVPKNDPRIVDALESINRIRNRTGFDPNLIKNRVWANKVSKDLIHGLAKVDEIGIEKRRRELSFVRNIEAERILLTKRLELLSRNLVRVDRHRQRSKSLSCLNSNLVSAYNALHKSVNNLKMYTAQLEEQGGFLLDLNQETKSLNESILDDSFIESNVTVPTIIRETESNELPLIDESQSCQETLKAPKIFSIHRHLITQPVGGANVTLRVRSPSLPSIQVARNKGSREELRRCGSSVPSNLESSSEDVDLLFSKEPKKDILSQTFYQPR